ncbi:Glyoxalase-like domain protein [Tsuneonella dongtanensis]|uniref:Glyoxalase-like domain protein n=1 Tax=Tsuneonella dongtanensis TaxID=692370 RepID=A0A1B2AGF8_9SPHN|nr:VOC family protein [Tsuneonella dongtanensis]ANY21232.1 Glyoxalase-like domain protein [Tsuneonella dongtanensis]
MPTARLEHVNISVTDADRTADLVARLTGWHRRWEGPSLDNGRSIHLGDDRAYVAIHTSPRITGNFSKSVPMNHIGIAVDDLAAAEAIVSDAGLEPFNHGEYDPGPRSFYFYDWDGIEWEIVCYE